RFLQVATSKGNGEWACALAVDRAVTCWLGPDVPRDWRPPPDGQFTQISAGWGPACGLRPDGKIACWGDTRYFGAPPSGSFTDVSEGESGPYDFACAVRTGGALLCWGHLPRGVPAAPPGSFIHVSAGPEQACGLRQDASILCWGDAGGAPPGSNFTQVVTGT